MASQNSGSVTMVEPPQHVPRRTSNSRQAPQNAPENTHPMVQNTQNTQSTQTVPSGELAADTNATSGAKPRSPGPQTVTATAKPSEESSSVTSSRPISPTDQDSDDTPDGSGDLQFKKKDFHKSRTQSFQSVLSSASLKSLKHQFTVPSQPQLKRNPSTISQGNTKNFQSFIQAPVLSSVTNLRGVDDVEIGQRLPFDQKNNLGADSDESRPRQNSVLGSANGSEGSKNPTNFDEDGIVDDRDDEDIYKEETTLQQQRLTLNALKKLSLSLAPIIRTEEDDQGPQARQLTTKSLNSPRQDGRLDGRSLRDLRPVLRSAGSRKSKPYQPAEVDLSSFSSLTRQSKHGPESKDGSAVSLQPSAAPDSRQRAESQIMQPSQAQVERASHSQNQAQNQAPLHGSAAENSSQRAKTQVSTETPSAENSARFDDMTNTSSERSLSFTAGGSKTAEAPGSAPKTDVETDASQKAALRLIAPSTAHSGSSKSGDPHVPGVRHQNLMRPAQISTNFNQRDITGRNQGHASEMSHASSFGSSKSLVSDKRLQQINGFRSPMYVPAVLRKTVDETLEFGSDVDAHDHHENDFHDREAASSANSIRSVDSAYSLEPSASPGFHSKTGPFELSKRQHDYILRAAPTRKHWLKDETVIECGIDACRKKFNFFERRHHCRKCGGIFCKEHTSHFLYINHLAQFTTGGRGTLSRVCDKCIEEYNEFMKHEFGVTCHKPSSRESLPQQTALNKIDYRKEIFTNRMANIPVKQPESGEDGKTTDQLVGSVPANWSWSSF